MQYLKEVKLVKFSVEVEKVNRNFEDFIPHADLVFISKDVAQYHGLKTKASKWNKMTNYAVNGT